MPIASLIHQIIICARRALCGRGQSGTSKPVVSQGEPASNHQRLPHAIVNPKSADVVVSRCRRLCTRSDQTRSTLAGVCGRVSSPTCRRQLARSHSNVQHSAFSPVTDGVNGARTQQVVREHGLIRTLRLLSILTQAALRGQGGSSLPEGAQLDYHCNMSNEPSAKAAKELRLLEEDDEFEEFKKQRMTAPRPPRTHFARVGVHPHVYLVFDFGTRCCPSLAEWDQKEEDHKDVKLWEDNWDDTQYEDDFSKQLR